MWKIYLTFLLTANNIWKSLLKYDSVSGYATNRQILRILKRELLDTNRDHIDLTVMLDGSKRATRDGFRYQQAAAKKLVRAVNAKSPINIKTGSEVALTQVSGQGHTDIAFRLDRHRSMRDIVKEIGREKYSKGSTTDIMRALVQAKDLYAIRSNQPQTHKKLVWFASNTDIATDKEILKRAKHNKKLGINICVIAIMSDNDVNRLLLKGIARADCFLRFRTWEQYRNRMRNAVAQFLKIAKKQAK